MTALLVMLAVLVPGIPLDEQPHLPHPSTNPSYERGLLREAAEARLELVAQEQAAVEAKAAAESEPEPPPPPAPPQPSPRNVWDRLAECESGDWIDGGRDFVEGSARWDYGINFAHPGYEQFQGGVNFHPDTWRAFKDPAMPDHAGRATREQQIVVAERVLAAQGWQAWPTCSRKLGLR